MEDSFISTCFASMPEDATSQDEWRVGFSLVIEGTSNQADWRAVVVADPIQEIELFLGNCGVW
jgi:hypothetical protein